MADPSFSSVGILVTGNGTNNSTTFVDNSSNAVTLTTNGDAKISTKAEFFVGTAINLDGTGDFITAPSSSNYAFPGDFTVEFQCLKTTNGSQGFDVILTTDTSNGNGTNGWFIELSSSRGFVFVAGTAVIAIQKSTINPNDGLLHHYRLTRSGTTLILYVDGVSVQTSTFATSILANGSFGIGGSTANTNYRAAGYIGEVRITKGVVRTGAQVASWQYTNSVIDPPVTSTAITITPNTVTFLKAYIANVTTIATNITVPIVICNIHTVVTAVAISIAIATVSITHIYNLSVSAQTITISINTVALSLQIPVVYTPISIAVATVSIIYGYMISIETKTITIITHNITIQNFLGFVMDTKLVQLQTHRVSLTYNSIIPAAPYNRLIETQAIENPHQKIFVANNNTTIVVVHRNNDRFISHITLDGGDTWLTSTTHEFEGMIDLDTELYTMNDIFILPIATTTKIYLAVSLDGLVWQFKHAYTDINVSHISIDSYGLVTSIKNKVIYIYTLQVFQAQVDIKIIVDHITSRAASTVGPTNLSYGVYPVVDKRIRYDIPIDNTYIYHLSTTTPDHRRHMRYVTHSTFSINIIPIVWVGSSLYGYKSINNNKYLVVATQHFLYYTEPHNTITIEDIPNTIIPMFNSFDIMGIYSVGAYIVVGSKPLYTTHPLEMNGGGLSIYSLSLQLLYFYSWEELVTIYPVLYDFFNAIPDNYDTRLYKLLVSSTNLFLCIQGFNVHEDTGYTISATTIIKIPIDFTRSYSSWYLPHRWQELTDGIKQT